MPLFAANSRWLEDAGIGGLFLAKSNTFGFDVARKKANTNTLIPPALTFSRHNTLPMLEPMCNAPLLLLAELVHAGSESSGASQRRRLRGLPRPSLAVSSLTGSCHLTVDSIL
jgi:hypothetical protein